MNEMRQKRGARRGHGVKGWEKLSDHRKQKFPHEILIQKGIIPAAHHTEVIAWDTEKSQPGRAGQVQIFFPTRW